MNIPQNTMLLPKTSDMNLLAQYYSLADAFVICSKKETFPTTCVEAQCCGTPVFGFDAGGTKETVLFPGDNFAGYGDLDSLQQIARRIVHEKSPELASFASKEYSSAAMYENYKKIYDKDCVKKRVLLIDVNCKNSSTGKIVYDLYTRLRSDGREASVCYGRGPMIHAPNIFKFGLDAETNAHALLARITGYNGCFSPFSTSRLIQYIRNFKPDVIHIHELHAYFVNHNRLLRFIQSQNIPVVWTFHCEYAYTGKCGHAFDCTGFQHNCGNCPLLHDYPKSLFFDHTHHMLEAKRSTLSDYYFQIVTPSRWLSNRVRLSFLKNHPVSVVHNGINTDIFHPVDATQLRSKLGIPSDKKIILALAPNIMSDLKGGEWVVKLAESMLEDNVFFLLVGVE